MNNLPVNLMISVLFLVGIIAVVIFIQIKLSQSKNKYFGLILPIISFLYSVLVVLGFAAFSVTTITTTNSVMVSEIDEQSGEIIEESEEFMEEPEEIVEVIEVDSNISGFLNLSFTFLVTNIPTFVLGGIYVSERNKITTRKEIEKMKIGDL